MLILMSLMNMFILNTFIIAVIGKIFAFRNEIEKNSLNTKYSHYWPKL